MSCQAIWFWHSVFFFIKKAENFTWIEKNKTDCCCSEKKYSDSFCLDRFRNQSFNFATSTSWTSHYSTIRHDPSVIFWKKKAILFFINQFIELDFFPRFFIIREKATLFFKNRRVDHFLNKNWTRKFLNRHFVLIQYSDFIFYGIQSYSVWFTFKWAHGSNVYIYRYS